MAVNLPPEMQQAEELKGSVMQDQPSNLWQMLTKYLYGSAPSEQFTSGFTSLMPGMIQAPSVFEGALQGAKKFIPRRMLNALETSPMPVELRERIGMGAQPGVAATYSQYPDRGVIRATPQHPRIEKHLGHELVHGAQDVAGKLTEDIPGFQITPEWKDVMRKYLPPGETLEENMAGEVLPYALTGDQFQTIGPQSREEMQAALNWLEQTYGKSFIERLKGSSSGRANVKRGFRGITE